MILRPITQTITIECPIEGCGVQMSAYATLTWRLIPPNEIRLDVTEIRFDSYVPVHLAMHVTEPADV